MWFREQQEISTCVTQRQSKTVVICKAGTATISAPCTAVAKTVAEGGPLWNNGEPSSCFCGACLCCQHQPRPCGKLFTNSTSMWDDADGYHGSAYTLFRPLVFLSVNTIHSHFSNPSWSCSPTGLRSSLLSSWMAGLSLCFSDSRSHWAF